MATLIQMTKEQLDFTVKLLEKALAVDRGEGLSADLARLAKDTVKLDEYVSNLKRARRTLGTDGTLHLHIDKPKVVKPTNSSPEGAGLFSDTMPEWEVMQMIRRLRVLPVREVNGGSGGDALGRLLGYLKIKPVKKNKD